MAKLLLLGTGNAVLLCDGKIQSRIWSVCRAILLTYRLGERTKETFGSSGCCMALPSQQKSLLAIGFGNDSGLNGRAGRRLTASRAGRFGWLAAVVIADGRSMAASGAHIAAGGKLGRAGGSPMAVSGSKARKSARKMQNVVLRRNGSIEAKNPSRP